MSEKKKSSGPKVYFPQNSVEAAAMTRSIEGILEYEATGRITSKP